MMASGLRNSNESAAVGVIGAGAWGTTLAVLAARAGNRVRLFVRDPEQAATIDVTRRNERAQPDLLLPENVSVSSSLEVVCAGAAIIVIAVPSQSMRDVARASAPFIGSAIVVSATKGLERGSFKRMTEVLREACGLGGGERVCALSGPNLAAEIAAGKAAVTVVAGTDVRSAERVRDLMMSPRFRCYTNEDVVGVEMGGALKNIIAIGAGMADGLDAGDNAKAAFLTRGIAEIARLGIAVGAQPLTFAGLAGLGDLVATCASPLSRNNHVGRALANGQILSEVLANLGHVAEGVITTEAAYTLGRQLGVSLPITDQTYAVLYQGKSAWQAIDELMVREPKHELAGLRDGV